MMARTDRRAIIRARGESAWSATSSHRILALWILVSAPFFFLLSFNSGYGFDQLEYLILGRALAEGIPLYTYIPSKSFGIYVVVSMLYRLGVQFDHASLALVITALYSVIVLVTYGVLRAVLPTSERAVTTLGAGMAGVCTIFMELNYLQPTAFVFLSGMVAYGLTLKGIEDGSRPRFLLSGIVLGIGVHFKAVASFYVVAIALFLLLVAYREGRLREAVFRWMPALAGGLLVSLLPPAVYFGLTARFAEFWQWTIVFPLLYYPPNTFYLPKLYTKLGAIHLLIVVGLLVPLDPRVRPRVCRARASALALLMGALSYIPLLKTQASHYYFPGAPFLCLFGVMAVRAWFDARRYVPRATAIWGALAGAAALVALAGVSYRPDALRLFIEVRRFRAPEVELVAFIQQRVARDQHILALRSARLLYWLAHRYPPGPWIDTAEQTTWLFRRRPELLLDALEDPQLVLVEFDPDQLREPSLDDPGFGQRPGDREILAAFLTRLQASFSPLHQGPSGYRFWGRRRDAPVPRSSARSRPTADCAALLAALSSTPSPASGLAQPVHRSIFSIGDRVAHTKSSKPAAST